MAMEVPGADRFAAMIVLLSPAKTLDFSPAESPAPTQPRLLEQSTRLIAALRKKSPAAIRKLMHVSESLATQNAERYQSFDTPDGLAAAKPALLAFKGDVYRGLDADAFSQQEMALSQNQIRILSGLYGLLRPLDLIQPYRLEMGTKLKVGRDKDLYCFWADRITELLAEDIAATGARVVLNAASKEYTACLDLGALGVPVVEADFRERRDGKLKFITYNAKVARGKLAQIVVRRGITDVAELADVEVNGYSYDEERSGAGVVAFTAETSSPTSPPAPPRSASAPAAGPSS